MNHATSFWLLPPSKTDIITSRILIKQTTVTRNPHERTHNTLPSSTVSLIPPQRPPIRPILSLKQPLHTPIPRSPTPIHRNLTSPQLPLSPPGPPPPPPPSPTTILPPNQPTTMSPQQQPTDPTLRRTRRGRRRTTPPRKHIRRRR